MGFFELFAIGLTGFYAVAQSFGVAIILLTLLVRLILLPLSIKQTRSMREMAVIQPEIKRIQAKYKSDRQKMNEEMMKLYKEHGVNPFGGCLPLLMQFPVLIGLFYVIRTPLNYMGYRSEDGGATWIAKNVSGIMETLQNSSLANDLTEHALSVNRFLGLRLDCYPSDVLGRETSATIPDVACGTGFVSFLPYLGLILLMGFTTWYQQKQMQASRGSMADNPQAQQMQMFAKIMPVMLMLFAFNFPTGVVIYWLTTNLWTIAQQRIILKAAPIQDAEALKAKAANGKGGRVAKALAAGTAGAAAQKKAKGDAAKKKATDGSDKGKETTAGDEAPKKTRPHPSSKKKKRR